MKTANIITLQNIRNYGSVLQAVATQEVMRRHGVDARFYDFYKTHDTVFNELHPYIQGKNFAVKVAKSIVLLPTFIKQKSVFSKFLKEYVTTLPGRIVGSNTSKMSREPADYYITGSDQTWNSGWNNGIIPPLFLSFAPEGSRKIAYAASFGKTALDDWEKDETCRLLSSYSAISVREASAVKIIDDLNLDVKAVNVLDPTLQVDGKFWRDMFARPVNDEKYLLLYQLNHNPEFDEFAQRFAKAKGLKLIRWCNRYDQMRLPADKHLVIPKVEDFVSYIAAADFVLTDSFHCTAFSINLGKQFLSVYPAEYGGRIKSILTLTDLLSRRVADLKDVEGYAAIGEIDYSGVIEILARERAVGDNFLDQALK